MAIPSSGDPEKDQADIRDAAQHQARMEENICPNGCAAMIWDDPHTRHCPECGFVGWCNVAFSGSEKHRA